MDKLKVVVFVATMIAVACPAFAADAVFLQAETTTRQTAVLATFVAYSQSSIETALSVSNLLGTPLGLLPAGLSDTEGTLELYIYGADGSLTVWESDDNSVGNGVLDDDGKLGPGKTWTALLGQILDDAGVLPGSDEVFTGYIWVVANFDAVQGTVLNVYPDFGYSQSLSMEPTMGLWFGGYPCTLP